VTTGIVVYLDKLSTVIQTITCELPKAIRQATKYLDALNLYVYYKLNVIFSKLSVRQFYEKVF